MRRIPLLLAVLALGLTIACGGGSDDGDSPSPTATTPASDASASASDAGSSSGSSGGAADSDFCSPEGTEAVFEGFDFTSAGDLEARLSGLSPAFDAWVEDAPSDIQDDARTAAAGMRGMIELLEEHDYDFLAMVSNASADPRLAAIQSPAFTEATNRIAAYCGIEIDAPALDGGSATGAGAPLNPTFDEGTLPDNFPEELIPPSSEVGLTADAGLGLTVQFTSTATREEALAFYEAVFGPPTFSDDEATLWSDFAGSSARTVTLGGSDGALAIVVVIVSGG